MEQGTVIAERVAAGHHLRVAHYGGRVFMVETLDDQGAISANNRVGSAKQAIRVMNLWGDQYERPGVRRAS